MRAAPLRAQRRYVAAAGLGRLVELVVHVQPFEDELGRAGGGRLTARRGRRDRAAPWRPAPRPASAGRAPWRSARARALVGSASPISTLWPDLEIFDDRPQLADVEVNREDILDRLVDDPMDQLVFVPVVFGHRQLELAPRAGRGEAQVRDPRHDPALAVDDRPPLGVRDHVFQVGDRHPHRHARLLVHVRRRPGQPRDLLDDLLDDRSESPAPACRCLPASSQAFWSLIAMPISRVSG